MSQKRRFAAGLAAGLTLISIAAVGVFVARSNAVSSPEAEPMLRVRVQAAEVAGAYDVERSFIGRVEAARESELGFELGGLLKAVWVEEGDAVARGERIAALDTERLRSRKAELEAAREQALAQLELARSTDARVGEAAELNAVSTQEWDEARQGLQARAAAVRQLDAQIRTLEVEIEKSILRAPFAGVVSARRVDEGEVLAAGRSVVRLLEAGRLEARVGVAASEASRLTVGDQLPVAVRGRTLTGKVKAVLPEREASTRTVTVLLELADAGAFASAGDLAEIKLSRSVEAPGYWLPTSALSESVRGLWSCFVVEPSDEGGDAYRDPPRALVVLPATTEKVYVRGTLEPGERVIVEGVHRVVPDQPVLLADADPAAADSTLREAAS